VETQIFATFSLRLAKRMRARTASFELLWKLFVKVCRDLNAGQVICVLDAIDECAMFIDELLL
jgi:hypothetical protein